MSIHNKVCPLGTSFRESRLFVDLGEDLRVLEEEVFLEKGWRSQRVSSWHLYRNTRKMAEGRVMHLDAADYRPKPEDDIVRVYCRRKRRDLSIFSRRSEHPMRPTTRSKAHPSQGIQCPEKKNVILAGLGVSGSRFPRKW
jgi:hypothetical protein